MSKPLIALVGAVFGTLFGAAPARAADFPHGTYACTVRNEKWTLQFQDSGKFTLKKKTDVVAEGTFKVTNDQIAFTDEKGPRSQPEHKPGNYTWKLDGKKLIFTKMEDASKGRAKALTTPAWVQE